MKHLSILISLCISFACNAQTIKENQVDEFTKNKVIRTSWEPLCKSGNIYAHVRASKINDQLYIDLKFMLAGSLKIGGTIFSIADGPKIMLKLSNDTIVTLVNPKYEIACRGCGAVNLIGSEEYGVFLKIPVEDSQLDFITSYGIAKMRIYTTDGYVESDIKEKFKDIIINELKLVKN